MQFFLIAPDSAHVVYQADLDVDEVVELYAVPLLGGTSAKLNQPLDGQRGVLNFLPTLVP